MNIKILTPEFVVFDGEVKSVLLPGKNGDFHIMKDHAAIVASLINGKIKVFADFISENAHEIYTYEKLQPSGNIKFSYTVLNKKSPL